MRRRIGAGTLAMTLALGVGVASPTEAQRPARAQILIALEAQGHARPLLPIGGVVAAGPSRAVLVVGAPHGRFGGECNPGAWDLHAAVVATGGPTLRVLGLVALPTEGLFASACEGALVAEPGSSWPRVATARARDLDQDGELEVMVVLEYTDTPQCGAGYTRYRQLYVVDLDPSPSLAASIVSRIEPQALSMGSLRGTVLFEDTNGDGHDDLVLRARSCDVEPAPSDELVCAPPVRTVYAYGRERDAWTRIPRNSPASAAPCDGE